MFVYHCDLLLALGPATRQRYDLWLVNILPNATNNIIHIISETCIAWMSWCCVLCLWVIERSEGNDHKDLIMMGNAFKEKRRQKSWRTWHEHVEEGRTQNTWTETNEKNQDFVHCDKGHQKPAVRRLPPTGRTHRGRLRVLCFVLEIPIVWMIT